VRGEGWQLVADMTLPPLPTGDVREGGDFAVGEWEPESPPRFMVSVYSSHEISATYVPAR